MAYQVSYNDIPEESNSSNYEPSWNDVPKVNAEKSKNVSTVLGEFPRNIPQLKPGTPENEKLIEEMIPWYAGGPGMNVIGQSAQPGVINQALKFAGWPLRKLGGVVKGAFKDLSPYEEAVGAAKAEENLALKKAQEDLASKNLESQSINNSIEETKNLIPGKISYGQPNTELESIENEIGRHLNIEAPHNIRVGESIKARIPSIYKFWGNSYKDFINKLKDSKFYLPKEGLEKIDLDINAIRQMAKEGKLTGNKYLKIAKPKESSQFQSLIKKAPTAKDSNAADFLSKYKDFRNGLHELRQEAKTTADEGLRRQLFKDIDKASKIESRLKQSLEKGLGEHSPEFKWLNEGYSKQVYPLRNNKIVKKLMNKDMPGKLSKDMVNELSGSNEGQEFLREIVKQDPEAIKNILGQQFKKNPGRLHNPDELIREYMQENTELPKLLKNRENYFSNLSKRKNISLENKIKAQNELKKIKSSFPSNKRLEAEKLLKLMEKQKIKNKWITGGLTTAGLGTVGMPPGLKWLARSLASDNQTEGME
jgi:hypothetical protein